MIKRILLTIFLFFVVLSSGVNANPSELKSCPYCGWKKSVYDSRTYKAHMEEKHKIVGLDGSGSFICPKYKCAEEFNTSEEFAAHYISDHYFHCDFGDCDYSALRKASLENHTRGHTGTELKCCLCSYKSTQISNLNRHVRLRHLYEKRQLENPEMNSTKKMRIENLLNPVD